MNFLFNDYHQKSKQNIISSFENGDHRYIKIYERFPITYLPFFLKGDLTGKFSEKNDINLISKILDIKETIFTTNKNEYSSSEVYIFLLKNFKDLHRGLYHYRKDLHALEFFYDTDNDKINSSLKCLPESDKSIFYIFITSVFERNIIDLGDRGYRYSLLEIGMLLESIKNNSIDQNVKVSLLEYPNETEVDNFIRIDGVTESIVVTLVGEI